MKTELTLENKAKFFAQYLGQKILSNQMYNKTTMSGGVVGYIVEDKIDGYLVLKPLSSISDEDAIEVATILKIKTEGVNVVKRLNENNDQCIFFETPFGNGYKRTGTLNLVRFGFDVDVFNPHSLYTLRAFDYLRSKGYALPWMGLSVDKMVEAGWIKLEPAQ